MKMISQARAFSVCQLRESKIYCKILVAFYSFVGVRESTVMHCYIDTLKF